MYSFWGEKKSKGIFGTCQKILQNSISKQLVAWIERYTKCIVIEQQMIAKTTFKMVFGDPKYQRPSSFMVISPVID